MWRLNYGITWANMDYTFGFGNGLLVGLSVVRRQGNFSFPSLHEAKAFGLVFIFLFQS